MKLKVLFISFALLVITTTAHAQQAIPLNQMVTTFQQQAAGWATALTRYALGTFGLLAILDLSWNSIKLALNRGDTADFTAMLINEIMFLGLFFWLMTTTNIWGPAIINSFRLAANTAGGVQTMQPGDILTIGVNISGSVLSAISFWTPKSSFVLVISGILLLVCFAYICAAMVIALIESWFVTGSAVLFMAFGGSGFTKDIAVSVIRHVFGLGTRLFCLQLIAATAANLGRQWVGQVGNMDSQSIMLILGCSLVLLGVAWEVPKSLERMVGGTSTTGPGGLFAGAAVGAGVVGGIGALSGSAAIGMAGVGAAVGQSARLTSAQLAASDNPSSGMGHAASMVGGTLRNLGSAAAADVGRQLSGQSNGMGSAPWRQAADLSNRRRLLGEDQAKPTPPAPPSNSIGGAP